MNDTQIKTRHGLILQGALAEALREAGYLLLHRTISTTKPARYLIS
jgi:hypothetical protein